MLEDGSLESVAFFECLMTTFVPAVIALGNYPNVEFRVGIISSLRRILPASCRALYNSVYSDDESLKSALTSVLRLYSKYLVHFLSDSPPIPQYSIRLLVETMAVSSKVEAVLATEVVVSGVGDTLLLMLGGNENGSVRVVNDPRSSGESAYDETFDPQVTLSLHIIFKAESSIRLKGEAITLSQYLLRKGLSSSIVTALQRAIRTIRDTGIMDCILLSEILTLLLDCLEYGVSHQSRDFIEALEDSNALVYNVLNICNNWKNESPHELTENTSQLQRLGCICLSAHISVFREKGIKTILYAKAEMEEDSSPISILRRILSDLSVVSTILKLQ